MFTMHLEEEINTTNNIVSCVINDNKYHCQSNSIINTIEFKPINS